MLLTFSSKEHDKNIVKQLLVDAINPELTYDSEHVTKVLESYMKNSLYRLYIWLERNEIIGVIGVEKLAPTVFEIRHISTHKSNRHLGIGSKIIDHLIQLENVTKLIAETDLDAVGFYRRYGFSIESLGEKYPGVERFQCTLEIQ